MIQENFKEAVFEFVKAASSIEGVSSITLFGSVAKEEATSESDIDILIVVSDMKTEKAIIETTNNVSDIFNKKFQVITKTKKLEDLDPSMIEEIAGDGILLYGSPLKIKQNVLELESYIIAIYSLTDKTHSEKMKFKRSIFGSESIFKTKNKNYKTVQKGLLKICGGAKLGRGAIIFPSKRKEIIKQFKYLKIRYKTFTIWADKHTLEWINTSKLFY